MFDMKTSAHKKKVWMCHKIVDIIIWDKNCFQGIGSDRAELILEYRKQDSTAHLDYTPYPPLSYQMGHQNREFLGVVLAETRFV